MSKYAGRRGFYFAPQCAKCGLSTGVFEVLGPGDMPERWGCWDPRSQQLHSDRTDTDGWRMMMQAGGLDNGVVGEAIELDDDSAAALHRRLSEGDVEALESASDDLLGHCVQCGGFYCRLHWRANRCPEGHLRAQA
ncbi:hypothetical protein H5392_10395 [Tessaracoccus sp. MC1865]|uniref:hypothetical protein n=1 Tax=Tessaracoccus sp. MC1865 TaxID=2760310 RepID=UPI0015FFA445|nr:hypothetical protein [Tessaracoccus sp. MC1865]MBB1484267.1 hypothetical protein [Tessaracoccus sp. MC1865]QTO37283.1 hypothetical protein J7D54_12760 [Tessaracoccus sp. MC1865]